MIATVRYPDERCSVTTTGNVSYANGTDEPTYYIVCCPVYYIEPPAEDRPEPIMSPKRPYTVVRRNKLKCRNRTVNATFKRQL